MRDSPCTYVSGQRAEAKEPRAFRVQIYADSFRTQFHTNSNTKLTIKIENDLVELLFRDTTYGSIAPRESTIC